MQTQILTRDYKTPPPIKNRLIFAVKKLLGQFSPNLAKLKSPKIITALVLLGSILVILLALTLMSQTATQKDTEPPAAIITQNEPSPSPKTNEITQEVLDYSNRLDDPIPYAKKLPRPIVDLEINLNPR